MFRQFISLFFLILVLHYVRSAPLAVDISNCMAQLANCIENEGGNVCPCMHNYFECFDIKNVRGRARSALFAPVLVDYKQQCENNNCTSTECWEQTSLGSTKCLNILFIFSLIICIIL